jgi:hypothetical protein
MFFKFPLRSILRPILVCLFIMSLYQALVSGGVIPAADGASLIQINIVKAQRYVYENNAEIEMVMVGSSLAANLQAKEIGNGVKSIALGGGASQTGLEIVEKSERKPPIVFVEINDTISRKVDADLIDSLYHPMFYWLRRYLPMLREEYRPVSVFIYSLKNRSNQNQKLTREEFDKLEVRNTAPELSEKGIKMTLDIQSQPLPEKDIAIIKKEAEYIKHQIAKIQKYAQVRFVLFDIPQESRVNATLRRKQVRELMQSLFPPQNFEWLPPPPPREWRTNDGIHLIRTDAQDFAHFVRDQLLSK